MIRLENMLPKAFLVGIIEMVDMVGPEKTYHWIESIGNRLAEIEGPGFEGARDDNINYLPVCPFGNDLIEFIEIYGERPEEYQQLIDFVRNQKHQSEEGWNYPALSSAVGILHNSYSKRRAELAGAKLLHLGSKSPVSNTKEYNEQAIARSGISKDEVSGYLDKSFSVFKIEYPEEE